MQQFCRSDRYQSSAASATAEDPPAPVPQADGTP
jgi:hypothetical protein